MTLLQRYLAVVPLSLLGGWLAGRLLMIPPAAIAASGPTSVAPAPARLPQSAWREWLDRAAPLPPPPDVETLWRQAATVGNELPVQRELWQDEWLFVLPWPQLAQVLSDERFCALSLMADYSQTDSAWRRRVLSADVGDALALAGELPGITLRRHLLQALLPKVAREAPDLGIEWFHNRKGDIRTHAQFLSQLIEVHPEKATELWRGMEPGRERDTAALYIMGAFDARNWTEGVAWVRDNLPADQQEEQIAHLLIQAFGSPGGRDALFAKAAETDDPMVRSLIYSTSLPFVAKEASGMMEQALALPADSLNAKGWNKLGWWSVWYELKQPESDPAPVAARLRALAAPLPPEHQRAFLEGSAELAAAARFPVATHLTEYLDVKGMDFMAKNWTQRDPTAASAWLATLEPSPKRDAAVAAFCRETATVDPAAAAQWAMSVSDPELKSKAVRDALGAWRQVDAPAAQLWTAAHAGLWEATDGEYRHPKGK